MSDTPPDPSPTKPPKTDDSSDEWRANRQAAKTAREERREMYRLMGKYSFIGIEYAVAVGGGFFLGQWLDQRWGTRPWLMATLVLLGIVVASRDLFRLARKAMKEDM